VPKPRTVIDLLAEQPEDVLRQMRDAAREELARVQTEVARLTIELQQIDQALVKLRRNASPARGVITGEQVLAATKHLNSPFGANDVQMVLSDRDTTPSVNAVRNHLNRLVDRGELTRDESGYSIPAVVVPEFVPASAEDESPGAPDDIPF
jgi:hypothetical protein